MIDQLIDRWWIDYSIYSFCICLHHTGELWGVSIVSILEKIDRIVTAPRCIRTKPIGVSLSIPHGGLMTPFCGMKWILVNIGSGYGGRPFSAKLLPETILCCCQFFVFWNKFKWNIIPNTQIFYWENEIKNVAQVLQNGNHLIQAPMF